MNTKFEMNTKIELYTPVFPAGQTGISDGEVGINGFYCSQEA